MGDADQADGTTERVVGLAGGMLSDDAVDELLQRVLQLVRSVVEPAQAVSITVVRDGGYRTANSTGQTALAVDEAQYGEGDGPCIEAIRTASQLQASVDGHGGRWRAFVDKAEEVGVAAVVCTPLIRAPGETIGALNIYSNDTRRFTGADLRTAGAIAEYASILVGNALELVSATQLNEQLREAVASREVIGMAKGMLMERQGCDRHAAFDILRRASQRENRKLRDLAEELVLRSEARARKIGPPG